MFFYNSSLKLLPGKPIIMDDTKTTRTSRLTMLTSSESHSKKAIKKYTAIMTVYALIIEFVEKPARQGEAAE